MYIDRYSASTDDVTADHFVRPSAVLMKPPTAQQIASVESNHIRRGILRSDMDGHEIIREEHESIANSAPNADRISTIIESRVAYSAYYDDPNQPVLEPHLHAASEEKNLYKECMDSQTDLKFGQNGGGSGYRIPEYKSAYEEHPSGYKCQEYKSMYE